MCISNPVNLSSQTDKSDVTYLTENFMDVK